jgi:hypothetical protein
MFRVTEQCASGRLVLKLEGRWSSDVVGELDASWRAVMQKLGERPLWVDVSDVSVVDDAAQAQLTRMHRAGVHFVTRGCFMRELIREISEAR